MSFHFTRNPPLNETLFAFLWLLIMPQMFNISKQYQVTIFTVPNFPLSPEICSHVSSHSLLEFKSEFT